MVTTREDIIRSFARVSNGSGFAAFAIVLIVLVGWLTGVEDLKRGIWGKELMHPVIAAEIILLFVAFQLKKKATVNTLLDTGGLITILVACLTLFKVVAIFHYDGGFEQLIADSVFNIGDLPVSPSLFFHLFFLSGAIFFYNLHPERRWNLFVFFAHVSGQVVLFSFLGDLFHSISPTSFAGFLYLPFPIAIALLLFSISLHAARPDQGLMMPISSDTAGGIMGRRMMPIGLIVPIILGYIRSRGVETGVFNYEFGLTLVIYLGILIYLLITWSNAFTLYDIDIQRREVVNKLKEEKVRAEQEKAKDEALLASIGDGMIATDKRGRVTFINEAGSGLLLWKLTDWTNKKIVDILAIADYAGQPLPPAKNPFLQGLGGGKKTISGRYHLVKKDGAHLPVTLTLTPVLLNGKLLGTITIFRDISAEIEIEQAKNEFVSIASHQLRTPLNAIKWNLELLEDPTYGKLEPAQADLLKTVEHANKNMIDLVSALLNVSRIDLGVFSIDPQPTNMDEVCRDVLDEFALQIKQKKQRVEYTGTKDVPIVQTDPKLLRIVVQNLVSNAIKYTPDNGKITITLNQENQPFMRLTVSDSGIGIPKAQQAKIYSKLFRADNAQKMGVNGTGLGLYICRSIVEKMNGKIWFESEEGKGTTFYVRLAIAGVRAQKGTKELEFTE
jgi:PAS domain S-box-containing protein